MNIENTMTKVNENGLQPVKQGVNSQSVSMQAGTTFKEEFTFVQPKNESIEIAEFSQNPVLKENNAKEATGMPVMQFVSLKKDDNVQSSIQVAQVPQISNDVMKTIQSLEKTTQTCKNNAKKNSFDDDKLILADDMSPVDGLAMPEQHMYQDFSQVLKYEMPQVNIDANTSLTQLDNIAVKPLTPFEVSDNEALPQLENIAVKPENIVTQAIKQTMISDKAGIQIAQQSLNQGINNSEADKIMLNLADIQTEAEAVLLKDVQVKLQDSQTNLKPELIMEPAVAALEKTLDEKTSELFKYIDTNLTSKTTSKGKVTGAAASTSSKSTKTETKTVKMNETDALFFNNLIKNNEAVMQGSKTANEALMVDMSDEQTRQSVKVSKSLMSALQDSANTNKPLRIDFDKDLSVIIRINRDGQVSAEFLPGDKAVEAYLKANMPQLKQRFDDQDLDYQELSYRQSKKEEQSERRKKENSHE